MERTVIIEKLSPKFTDEKVIQAAVEQFAAVSQVRIPRSPFDPTKTLGMAVVELASEAGTKNVLQHFQEFMVLIGGMPRPVSARPAIDPNAPPVNKCRPKPRVVSCGDPEFTKLSKLKKLNMKQAEQRKALQVKQIQEQKALDAEQQQSMQRLYKMLQDCEKVEVCLNQLRSLYTE